MYRNIIIFGIVMLMMVGLVSADLSTNHLFGFNLNDNLATNVLIDEVGTGNGILLVGGGALLPGLKTRIENALKIKVTIPADPLHSVANGIGKILAKPAYYDSLLHNPGDSF